MSFYYNEPFLSFNDIFPLFDSEENGRRGGPRSRTTHRGRVAGSQSPVELGRGGYQPKVDIYESEKENLVTVVFELPGISKEAITLDINPQNGRLSVSGDNSLSYGPKDNEHGWVHRERPSGRFSRAIPLPAGTEVSL